MGDDKQPLRLLSLDGGGIRGYSELLMIEAIMRRVQMRLGTPVLPLPADYFDLIAGTSAGGLIAIMLGRLRMTVAEAKESFEKLSVDMFARQQTFKLFEEGRLDDKVFTSIIKDVIKRRTGDPDARLRTTDEQSCKIFVCTVCRSNVPQVRLFRSYISSDALEHDCGIWEAARATSAAPTYYPPIDIGPPGLQERFMDGGVGCNNPIYELHVEAERLFEPSRQVACIISLGTGKRKLNQMANTSGPLEMLFAPTKLKGARDIVKSFKRMALDSDNRANDMDRKYRDLQDLYFRFTVEHGLQDVKLAEPQKMADVATQTLAYMSQPNISAALDQAADALIGKGSPQSPKYSLGHLSLSNRVVIETTQRETMGQRTLSDRRTSIAQWLSGPRAHMSPFHDYRHNLSKRFSNSDSGHVTCSWVFDKDEFKEVLETTRTGVLWLNGRTGSGKSVIASSIISKLSDRIAAADSNDHQLLYFFCNPGPYQTTLKDVICGFLEQLSRPGNEVVIRSMEDFSRIWPNLDGASEELTNTLLGVLRALLHHCCKKLFVVVDSIESCAARSSAAHALIHSICCRDSHYSTSFFLTSRHSFEPTAYPALAVLENDEVLHVQNVEISSAETATDLRTLVEHRVNNAESPLANQPEDRRHEIIETVIERADGLFLYATLVLDELKGDKLVSKGAIKSTLRKLPDGISGTYERQLESIYQKWKAQEVFWWIYAANRQLTWNELRNGIAIVNGTYDTDEIIEQSSKDFVQDTCGLLVELCGQDKAYLRFSHPTIREWLDEDEGPKEKLELHLAHPTISTKLLALLNFPAIILETPEGTTDTGEGIPGRELHQYAIFNWYKHLKLCGSYTDEGLETALIKFLGSSSSLSWLVDALLAMKSRQDHGMNVYSFVEEVTDCLWTWIRGKQFCLGDKVQHEVESWGMDFLTLMLDWRNLLERQPRDIHFIHFDLLPKSNRFRELSHAKTSQSVVRFGTSELPTHSSLKPTWQWRILAVDESRDFAYVCHQGYLQCFHTKTRLLVAETPLGAAAARRAILSPDKTSMALLLDRPTSFDESTITTARHLRSGLQLSSINSGTHMMAWRLENERDLDETRALSSLLFVPDIHRHVFFIRLNHEGSSRATLFEKSAGMKSFALQSFDSKLGWTIDDVDFMAFSGDSSDLTTPAGIASLKDGKTTISFSKTGKDKTLRSTKITGDSKTLVTIRNRKSLEFWDTRTQEVRHETKITGVGHVLTLSHSGKFALLLRIQDDRKASMQEANQKEQIQLRPQRGTICIYDSETHEWLDLLILRPPTSKKLDAWGLHRFPLEPKFAMEGQDSPRVALFVPPGWVTTPNILPGPTLQSRLSPARGPHLLVFEGQQGQAGFGTEPILRHMMLLPGYKNDPKAWLKLPKLLSWDDSLESILLCHEGQLSRLSVGDLQARLDHLTQSTSVEETQEATQNHTMASAILVSSDQQSIYRVQLVARRAVESGEESNQRNLETSQGHFGLIVQSLEHPDNRPVEHHIDDVKSNSLLTAPRIGPISVNHQHNLLIGSLEFKLSLDDAEEPRVEQVSAEQTLFHKAAKAFEASCHPLSKGGSSVFDIFSSEASMPNLTIFSKSDTVVGASFIKETNKKHRFFVSTVTPTNQEHLSIAQYSRMLDVDEPASNFQKEAQPFELFLAVFDDRHGITWMTNTITAGSVIKSRPGHSFGPQVAWALHPRAPLLAWVVPGHRVRISHIGSNRQPLNISEPLHFETDASDVLQFSPKGNYLLMQGRDASCNVFFDAFLDIPSRTKRRNITVFDFESGVMGSMTCEDQSQLSVDMNDDTLRISRVTRNGVVETSVYELPGLALQHRSELTNIPNDCCCPTCGTPFQKFCNVRSQAVGGLTSITLSHIPISFIHGSLNQGACEPLILRAQTSRIRDASGEDIVVTEKTSNLCLRLFAETGELDLAAFDKYMAGPRGVDFLGEINDALDDDHDAGEITPQNIVAIMLAAVAKGMFNTFEGYNVETWVNILNILLEGLRARRVKQPKLKMSDFYLVDRGVVTETKLSFDQVEKQASQIEEDATSQLSMGPTLEENCEAMFSMMKDQVLDFSLPYDTWAEFSADYSDVFEDLEMDIVQEMRSLIDRMYGLESVGVGCKVPLMIYTFYFGDSGEDPKKKKEEEESQKTGPSWTLALDVGWIEEETSMLPLRILRGDMVSARSWYIFSNLRKAQNSPEAAPNTSGTEDEGGTEDKDGFEKSMKIIAKMFDMNMKAAKAPKPQGSSGGQEDSRKEHEANKGVVLEDLAELSEVWQDGLKNMSGVPSGQGDFVKVRLNAMLSQSMVKDLEE